MIPKASGYGIKVDSLGTPTFGWHDLLGNMFVPDYAAGTAPTRSSYVGGIVEDLYSVGDECQVRFHIPHDYVPGTNLYIHAHWSHNSALVTGGTITIGWELTYAKGHGTGTFSTPIVVVEQQSASTIQRRHMVLEAPISIPGGSANLLDTALLETDGMIFGRMYLVANEMTVSGGGVPGVFLHQADIHYQSTSMPTKNRAPSFWA
jgi:hypothetical protein